jgi:hypothetical protein
MLENGCFNELRSPAKMIRLWSRGHINNAGLMDLWPLTRHRHDLSGNADEIDRYNAARRVLQHWQYALDSDRVPVIRLMAQRVVEAGETAETDSIQAAFRDLLGEFGQRQERTAESKENTATGMLAAFCHRQTEMLSKARALLAQHTLQSKAHRQSSGQPYSAPGQHCRKQMQRWTLQTTQWPTRTLGSQ